MIVEVMNSKHSLHQAFLLKLRFNLSVELPSCSISLNSMTGNSINLVTNPVLGKKKPQIVVIQGFSVVCTGIEPVLPE